MSIHELKAKYEDKLMSLPNVRGVAIGEKAGRAVIQVLVTHKVPESTLRREEIVPKDLEGTEVEVREIGLPMAQKLA